MKRCIHAKQNAQNDIDFKIDLILIVDNAEAQNIKGLPVVASTQGNDPMDYDQYSIEELMDLSQNELRSIDTFYALDNLMTAVREYGFNYKFTTHQKQLLSEFYKDPELSSVDTNNIDVVELIRAIRKCNDISGPYYRNSEPEKNFAKVHGLKMVSDDYLNIIKQITPNELYGAVKSFRPERLGIIMYEFIHDPKGYKLEYSGQQIDDDIKIYIKLIPHYANKYNIAVISFHDPLD